MAALQVGHYWSRDETSFEAILELFYAGTNNKDEDRTWGAWEAILPVYFPTRAATANGIKYQIKREAYRGLPPYNPSQHKPDVVVVQLTMPAPQPQPPIGAPPPPALRRDILWVECKAPSHDAPNEWNAVIKEATERLAIAHPTRNVWLILATGLKWIVLYWNPLAPPLNPPLAVLKAVGNDTWDIDGRLHLPALPGHNLPFVHNVQGLGQVIVPSTASSLDFWSVANNQPLHVNDMILLEAIFTAVQAGVYPAQNPPSMS